jgi:hypothetical protein
VEKSFGKNGKRLLSTVGISSPNEGTTGFGTPKTSMEKSVSWDTKGTGFNNLTLQFS